MRNEVKNAYDEVKFDENRKSEILDVLLTECEDKKKETFRMNRNLGKVAAIVASVIVGVPMAGYAAMNYLSAGQTAESLGSKELSQYFKESDVIETCVDGDYRFLYLGNATAKLQETFLSEAETETTYVALAIERTDGQPVSADHEFVASPLIQGLNPMEYNVYSMGGGATWQVIDGVCYMLMSVDSIEMFADKEIYLAITTGPDYATGYVFNEADGSIQANDSFEGINVIFKMDMDKSKANLEAQAEYLGTFNEHDEDIDNIIDPNLDSAELFRYLVEYDFENLDISHVIKIRENMVERCIDSYEFPLVPDGYNVSMENEYGSQKGFANKDLYTRGKEFFGVWVFDPEEGYIIFEDEYRDNEDVLHVKHYFANLEQLNQIAVFLKSIEK